MSNRKQDLVSDQSVSNKGSKVNPKRKSRKTSKAGNTKGYFKQRKRGKVFAIIAVLLIIAILFVMCGRSDKDNYLTITDKLLSKTTGSFRYVIDVRTNEHTDDSRSQSDSVSDIADLEKIEANADTDKVLEEYQQAGKEFVSWSNKDGVEVLDWDYPKYKIILEGNVASTSPLEMNMTMSLVTNYFNDSLTDIVVKDNKTYVNIEQLRYWLLSSKDDSLVRIGETLPESTKYVEYDGDEFNLYSTFAEESEIDASRESDLMNVFKRFLVAMKATVPKLSIDSDCLTTEGDIYRLNITGDNSISLLKSIKAISLGVGDHYRDIIATQYKNNILTKDQYNQAINETDNVVSAFKDFNANLGVLDLEQLDLQVSGNARTYTGGKGSSVYESSLAFQVTSGGTDYSVAMQLSKSSQVSEVKVPTESTTGLSTFNDKDFVQKTLIKVFDHLNIMGIDVTKQLEVTSASLKSDLLDSFIEYVNEENVENENFSTVTKYNVLNYINTYRDYKSTDETTDMDKLNAKLVSDFLKEFEDLIPEEKSDILKDSWQSDESRFSSVVYENDNFRIYADFDKDSSNTRCVLVKSYILNKTNEKLEFNINDFTLQTMISSKYPANYQSLLEEYDNEFDMSKAPATIEVDANGYAETSLYFVIANGLEYMDMWYQGEKLGVVVNR